MQKRSLLFIYIYLKPFCNVNVNKVITHTKHIQNIENNTVLLLIVILNVRPDYIKKTLTFLGHNYAVKTKFHKDKVLLSPQP